ncbi:MAG: phosphoglycolate phosphatase [Saccharospirillaceae bacterium]|nr:phosphoglycolate phosphatase [Saccharospirillaceae bacterium]MCD8529801.1 phosphoglycolate phosphatase [Saccharospirillaceae bacterium]
MRWNAALSAHFTATAGPQLLLLDLDGTLIDSVPDLAAAVDTMLLGLGRDAAGAERVSHWVGNGADLLIRRALCSGDEQAAVALAAEVVKPARALFDQAYLSVLHDATGAYPGVSEWLQRVTTAKVLITNKPRLFTLPLLQSLGWEEYFVQVLCGDDLAEKKPSPMPLLHACQTQNITPQQALMIGDSRNDIQAAKAAGIASVAVTYGYNHGEDIHSARPDWVVDNLLQLLG